MGALEKGILPLGTLVLAAALTGCGGQAARPVERATTEPSPVSAAKEGGQARLPTFAEATIAEPPSEDQMVPPETTMTGKSVGRLYTEVVKQWDALPLRTSEGQWIAYRVTLETEQGDIEITLRPELAPQHVGNFLALAGAGYYDGLVFERVVRVQAEDDPSNKLELLEAGCPLGTGDAGCGSIGYWMKPEFTDTVHEEGTVGAFHDEEQPDTAACKFYITLSKAPVMDGNYTVFGKVSHGLDAARRILVQPNRDDPAFPGGDRPVRPVVIRRVVIHHD